MVDQFNKLGALLESKNSAIREEAVQVFAQLPFTDSTLSIVKTHLVSNSWHSRVAAADAFGLLLKNCAFDQTVPVWKWHDSGKELNLLSVDTLLSMYHPLLSTEGSALDSEGVKLSAKEQRATLNKLLEFDQAGLSSGFLKDDELVQNHEAADFSGENISLDDDVATNDLVTMMLRDALRNMVDPKWEIRHGGVLSLEKILIHYFERLGPILVEKVTIRLVQLLTLDRFFDFVSGGSSVAPVRETAAKCVSLLIVKLPQDLTMVSILVENIRTLLNCSEDFWYCRQSALLVLKYFFALSNRSERFLNFFQSTLDVLSGDTDEVLSAAIIALSALLANNQIDVTQRTVLINKVIAKIWSMLSDSHLRRHMRQGVDSLLVDILKIVELWLRSDEGIKLEREKFLLLVDLVEPGFVKRSTLALVCLSIALLRGVELEHHHLIELLSNLLKTLLLCSPTDTEELIRTIFATLDAVMTFHEAALVAESDLAEIFGKWMSCLVVDLRSPIIDMTPFNETKAVILCGEEVRVFDEATREDKFVNRKLQVARFLSPILDTLYKSGQQLHNQKISDSIQLIFKPWVTSAFGSHRFGAALILNCWARVFRRSWNKDPEQSTALYPTYIVSLLQQSIQSPPPMNQEMSGMVLNLTAELNTFRQYCVARGVTWDELNGDQSSSLADLAKNAYDLCLPRFRSMTQDVQPLTSRYEQLMNKVNDVQSTNSLWNNRINALFSSCLFYFAHAPTSITPLVRPLMEALSSEKNEFLRRETLHDSFTLLISTTAQREPCPHSKIVKQLTQGLMSCDLRSPKIAQWESEEQEETILSVKNDVEYGQRSLNCEFMIQVLSGEYGPGLLNICTPFADLVKWSSGDDLQEQMLKLEVVRLTSQFIQHSRSEADIGRIRQLMASRNAAVRLYVARYVATLAAINLADTLNDFYPSIIGNLQMLEQKASRLGAVEVIFRLAQFESGLLGAIPLFAPLTFAAMSDGVQEIRETAAVAFRKMVAIMPLEQGGNFVTDELNDDLKNTYKANVNFLNVLSCPARLPIIAKEEIVGLDQAVDIRHYQLEGITWMRFLYGYGLNGILADDMGLGKTLQTLCLIALWMKTRKNDEISLIVCPKTLVNHWCKEWERYFPSLPRFTTSYASFRAKKGKTANEVAPVVVTSYEDIRADATIGFSKMNYEYLILDEGHCIRNHNSQLFKILISITSRHRLILSGTPVQNSPADLWSLFRFLMPGYLSARATFFANFMKPIMACRNPKANEKQTKDGTDALQLLHKQVLPFVLRRLKSEVLQELPEKVIQDYPCYLSEQQKALYQAISECCSVRSQGIGLSPLTTLTALRKVVDHPALIAPAIFETIKFDRRHLDRSVEMSGKMVALKQLLNECNIGAETQLGSEDSNDVEQVSIPMLDRHRALIFCQWRDTVDMIAHYIDNMNFGPNISYLRLDGTIPAHERQDVADKFNRDPSYDLLLLTTHIGGVGLTLTGANVVIFVDHDWNPVKDLQAIDRAHRLGQKRTVHVYRLITQGTIEEKVMNYQKFKIDTANALIGSENKSLSSMATDGLMDLLTFSDDSKTPSAGIASSDVPSAKRVRRGPGEDSMWDPHMLDMNEKKWNLEELWDESQYEEQHSVANFVKNIH
uniref:Importin N-terminal domain-containing protein n=1 Tax=Steinernema glaseri TaxID=37863 RepID=A0A1I8AFN7_9BILA